MSAVGPRTPERPPERTVGEWLMRMHEASRQRSYAGTFIVSSNAGGLFSARIWHACEGDVQVERVESLTGAPRSVYRRNEQVVTFYPEQHVVRTERRESLGVFTNLIKSSDSSIPDYYVARRVGNDRVAGFETDVVQLAPRDNLRFGYRLWSEKKSGLVVKLLYCHLGASTHFPPSLRSATGSSRLSVKAGAGLAGQHRQSCAKNGLDCC